MSSMRELARLAIPPLLWKAPRKLKRGFSGHPAEKSASQLYFEWTFKGPFETWEDAKRAADGWDCPATVQKTLDISRKVRDGIVEFQQDGHVFETVQYSNTILAFLALAISLQKTSRLDIIDFGGALGVNYYQNRKVLNNLVSVPYTWNLIDMQSYVAIGKKEFADRNLNFYSDLDELAKAFPSFPECLLFSGSMQYLREPFSIVDEAIARGVKLIALDRMLVSPIYKNKIFLQQTGPYSYEGATFPVRFFFVEGLTDSFRFRGFRLVERFTNDLRLEIDHVGMIFMKGL